MSYTGMLYPHVINERMDESVYQKKETLVRGYASGWIDGLCVRQSSKTPPGDETWHENTRRLMRLVKTSQDIDTFTTTKKDLDGIHEEPIVFLKHI